MNNLDAYYYSPEDYAEEKKARKISVAITVIGLTTLGVSFFLRSSLSSVYLISAMQICYLGLAAVDGLHPVAAALQHTKPVVGINKELVEDTDEAENLDPKIAALEYEK